MANGPEPVLHPQQKGESKMAPTLSRQYITQRMPEEDKLTKSKSCSTMIAW